MHLVWQSVWLDTLIAHLVVDVRINFPDLHQVLVELQLGLVDPLREGIRAVHLLVKLVRTLVGRSLGLPPWVSLDLIPVDPADWIFLKNLFDQIVEL